MTHFCAGLPVLLVGCKKDLRRDPKTIEELRKTSQRPVTPEEVRSLDTTDGFLSLAHALCRALLLRRRLARNNTWNVQRGQERGFEKCSNTRHVMLYSQIRQGKGGRNALYFSHIVLQTSFHLMTALYHVSYPSCRTHFFSYLPRCFLSFSLPIPVVSPWSHIVISPRLSVPTISFLELTTLDHVDLCH